MTASPLVQVRDLHRFFGDFHAVRGISFDILAGQVVGFIGANGAGKTTTMRIMATLDLPSSGNVVVDGYDVLDFPEKVRPRLGWMPDTYGSYENVTVWEYLDFYARAYHLYGAERRRRVQEVMEFADLADISGFHMNRLSKGMGQRLCLGRTLLSDPALLILDEPAAGLDPKARIEFKNLVRLLAGRGKTIFISSHILSELDEMCDTLLFIDKGVIVHHGETSTLKRQAHAFTIINVEVAGDPESLYAWVPLQPGLRLADRHKRGARIALEPPAAAESVLRRMIQDGIPVADFHREERRLEDAFVDLLRGQPAATPPPIPSAVAPPSPPRS